jgi:hypothetical protein
MVEEIGKRGTLGVSEKVLMPDDVGDIPNWGFL